VNKTLKILGLTLATLFGLLIAAAVTLVFVFDPNQYKDDVIRLVKEKTGRNLKIEKKIGWSFFPRLGIEAGGLELSNAAGFGKDPFAKIDAVGVHVAVLPLFRGKVEVGTVYLNGLTLNLAKNAAGKTNWDDLAAPKDAKPAPKDQKPAEAGTGGSPLEGLSIGRLEVHRTNLYWRDMAADSTLAVRNIELATSRFIAGEPMNLKLAFELVRDKAAPVKAALQSRLTASADALKLANVDLKVDDSRLAGSIDIQNFASPALRFDLTLDKIDLDRYLVAAPEKPAAAKPAPAAEAPIELPLSTLRSLNINGKFRIQDMKAMGLRSKEVQVQIAAKNGLIALGPNTAKLYSGSYRGETSVDVRGKTPVLRIDESLQQVQLGPLLKDMQLFDRFSGTGNVALKLGAQGFDANQVKRSLNGNASVAIQKGRIEGVDLNKFMKTLNSKEQGLEKLVKLVPQRGDFTDFAQLNATFQVANGYATSSDLALRTLDLAAGGRGFVDLPSDKMDYRLELANIGELGKKCKTFPLRIHGPLAKLSYDPVWEEIAKCQVRKQAEKQLEKQLKKGLGDLLKKK
jgi:AsmA protein